MSSRGLKSPIRVIKSPSDHVVQVGGQHLVRKEGGQLSQSTLFIFHEVGRLIRGEHAGPANILEARTTKSGNREVYVSFVGSDKRLDAWVKESEVGGEVLIGGSANVGLGLSMMEDGRKRKRLEVVRRSFYTSFAQGRVGV